MATANVGVPQGSFLSLLIVKRHVGWILYQRVDTATERPKLFIPMPNSKCFEPTHWRTNFDVDKVM